MRRVPAYLGVFFVSVAALGFEISLIRFFSISQSYHFAFMIVSIALFGIAAAGTFLYSRKKRIRLFWASVLFSLSAIAGFWLSNRVFFDPHLALVRPLHLLVLVIYYLLLGLPFFFFGLVIASCFMRFQRHAGKVYFFNLAGSAIGSLLALALISALGARAITVISGVGLAGAAFFLYDGLPKNRAAARIKLAKRSTTFIILVLFLLAGLVTQPELKISPYKELSYALSVPGSRHVGQWHDIFSRVDIVNSSFTRYAPGLTPSYTQGLPAQLGLTVDAGNMNAIISPERSSFLEHLPPSVAYHAANPQRVLVLNAGGGLQVLNALRHNASVTAIEPNRLVIRLLSGPFAGFTGNITEKAEFVWSDGRSYLKKTSESFDLIVISLSGNVVNPALAGLSENYLLTVDAFRDYLDRLSPRGMLVVERWLAFPPRESLRLLSLALSLDREAEKTALVRSWNTVTLVMTKGKMSNETAASIMRFAETTGFDLIYLPSSFEPNKRLAFERPYYYELSQKLISDPQGFYNEYVFDVRPVADNKPFYSYFYRPSKTKELLSMAGSGWNPFLDPGFVLLFLLAQVSVIAAAVIVAPLLIGKKRREKKEGLPYFFAIGIGYLLIEITLIQRLALPLGHIALTSAVVVFGVLLYSSAGAWLSGLLDLKPRTWAGALVALIGLYALMLPLAIKFLLALGLAEKIAATLILLAPLGTAMGVPFPSAIRRIRRSSVPLAWAFNGTASVISPIIAVITALFLGYAAVLFLAAASYLIAMGLSPGPCPQKAQTSRR